MLCPLTCHTHRSQSFRAAADTPIRVQALQLLPSFLAASEPTRAPVVAALDAMVMDVFPPSCRDLWACPAGQPAVDYGVQLLALLDAGATAAARHANVGPVLTCLQYVVKEMGSPKGHLLQLAVARCLAAMAAAPWATAAPVDAALEMVGVAGSGEQSTQLEGEAGVDARAAATADAMAEVALQWLWQGVDYPVDIKCAVDCK